MEDNSFSSSFRIPRSSFVLLSVPGERGEQFVADAASRFAELIHPEEFKKE